jgi:hypothetical protein
MLLTCEGGETDEEKAVFLITDATKESHVISQFNLGVLYDYVNRLSCRRQRNYHSFDGIKTGG